MFLLEKLLNERILILDGGMGSLIQQYNLVEEDYRGSQFAHLPGSLKGNGDMLCITRPDVIQAIHAAYLEAGADIIETNSLNMTSISMSDYGMETYIKELNLAAARIAKEVADKYTRQNPDKPRFVAGSIGPTNKTASISPDVANPAYRSVTFDELYDAYKEQILALIEGGVDALLIETAFDTLNVKAALMAAEHSIQELKKEIPLMVSFTIAGKSGRILSGQTLEAALASISHVPLLSVGLNCSFGARDMKPFIKELERIAPCYTSAYPNAGLPNSLGQYDETPESMALQIKEYIDEGLVNIVGGCCGTTPAHIARYVSLVKDVKPRRPVLSKSSEQSLRLSGLDILKIDKANETVDAQFIIVGERCNVAGSRRFLRLIKEKKYEEALNIARKQVEDGAQILDINVDDGLLDGVEEITVFLNMIASEPDIARVPIMLDSSNWDIIVAGLKCLQGKSIVNSISLKGGEADFLQKARTVHSYGAAVIAMAFDEKGQADTFERKTEIASRQYKLLTEQAGFLPRDIIFDPNVLAISTGIEEHAGYGLDFIRTVEWIKTNLPGAKVSGGISNLSFAFRGNDYLREAMHAVFLYHCAGKGMDMGIVNPSASVLYDDIDVDLRQLIEDVILNRRPDAAEQLLEYAQNNRTGVDEKEKKQEEWRSLPLPERLQYALIKGIGDYLESDLAEALSHYPRPIDIVDQPLMEGMNVVGKLFGEGKMFLPQVVKTARTMKKAVTILQPAIEADKKTTAKKAGKILLATVKGDVHDIGKNITGVVLSCNNYEIIDIGVMVPPEDIIRKAKEHKVDMVGLSGLITPSLQEMAFVASEMGKAGFTLPLLIGGAATSKLHTALKIDPLYQGPVIHVTDASLAAPAANQLLNPLTKEDYVHGIKDTYQSLRNKTGRAELVSLEYAREHAFTIDRTKHTPDTPSFIGTRVIEAIPVKEIIPYINWLAFMSAWKFPVRYGKYMKLQTEDEKRQWLAVFSGDEKQKAIEAIRLLNDAQSVLTEWANNDTEFIRAIIGFFPVKRTGDTLIVDGSQGITGQARYEIPFLRQQEKRESDVYKSLADFFHPDGDYAGFFTATAGANKSAVNCHCGHQHEPDAYTDMIQQILRDRLVEATAEYLHEKVRKELWEYAPEESYTVEELMKEPYRGIRPASGYPSHPDLSLNFIINELLGMERIGLSLTPNGAIYPNASVAGLYISHPEADYFLLGKISDEQIRDYADRKGITTEEAKRWLGI
ncbi:MAG: methionine synthase [Dysgonamonadaceae bacterium]|jgi:5-methyltetrahydrofolate--homocysteine methyltransferase|nr:methionine synthase [Dysgonamonadaceae bacterium]